MAVEFLLITVVFFLLTYALVRLSDAVRGDDA